MTQTISFDFDTPINRHDTGSDKWTRFGEEILPMWVADMDFQSPPAVLDALRAKVEHGVFGYTMPPPALPQLIVDRMQARYGWQITPNDVLFSPGVMVSVSMAAQAFARGGSLLIHTPVYFPFHRTPAEAGVGKQEALLQYVKTDDGFTYEIDFDAMEAAITPETKVFLFCSPHNPLGRVWRRDELERLSDLCITHDLIMISDEIHSDLLMSGYQHIPSAMVREEMRNRAVTLIAPSKTFNVPGLGCSVAIIENPELRRKFGESGLGTVMMPVGDGFKPHLNIMGYVAAEAAYRYGDPWLEQVLTYIEANYDFACDYIREHIPQIKTAKLEGTYLLWMDCRALDLPPTAGDWFREHAKVAFNIGETFGAGGEGFARMNLGTSRSLVKQAPDQMRDALAKRK
jgi:cystathionine beta-lyase